MDLDRRIAYWRGRKTVAERNALAREAEMCDDIVRLLLGARKSTAAAERKVNAIVAAMPAAFSEVEE